jgi:hypothetical protein
MTNEEIRMTNECPGPNDSMQSASNALPDIRFYVIGHSSVLRHSDFVISRPANPHGIQTT